MAFSESGRALGHLVSKPSKTTLSLTPLPKSRFKRWLEKQKKTTQNWVKSVGFSCADGDVCLLPNRDGQLVGAVVGVSETIDAFSFASFPAKLPKGRYNIDEVLTGDEATLAAVGWALGTYRFERYKSKSARALSSLVWPENANQGYARHIVEGITLGRDLINTPASDMGPSELADVAKELATHHKATLKVIKGKKLLAENFPTVHAVGRASDREPLLIDMTWGDAKAPKLTLVGKGVCFDSGGLDLKSAANMKLMKKDMGGAATVLGLAHAIMAQRLGVRLRVLVPAVENSVSGNAMRPLDVITTRKGITVEVGNTDAEGRLILCDALAAAEEESPDLLMDFATLTGAARVALGTDLPALFATDDDIANALLAAGEAEGDPMWRLPVHAAYRKQIDSPVADVNNISSGGYGGAITAALYLKEFVSNKTPWVHVDLMGWNLEKRPGRPTGGEPMTLRAMMRMLSQRYPSPEAAAEASS